MRRIDLVPKTSQSWWETSSSLAGFVVPCSPSNQLGCSTVNSERGDDLLQNERSQISRSLFVQKWQAHALLKSINFSNFNEFSPQNTPKISAWAFQFWTERDSEICDLSFCRKPSPLSKFTVEQSSWLLVEHGEPSNFGLLLTWRMNYYWQPLFGWLMQSFLAKILSKTRSPQLWNAHVKATLFKLEIIDESFLSV